MEGRGANAGTPPTFQERAQNVLDNLDMGATMCRSGHIVNGVQGVQISNTIHAIHPYTDRFLCFHGRKNSTICFREMAVYEDISCPDCLRKLDVLIRIAKGE